MLYIGINTQFTATHHWPDCPFDEVAFLRNPHRHVFHVKMKWKVDHNDRNMEFIMVKNFVDKYLNKNYHLQFLGAKSCEMIAEELGKEFDADFVSVYEDNENGAEYIREI